jgi:DNA-binding NtrC family response regulator
MNGTIARPTRLAGARILLVEDNFLVGHLLRSMLERMGCAVSGPIASLDDGRPLAAHGAFDAAVLDIQILGGTSVPLAEELQRRGCPVIFVTGYGSPRALPEPLRKRPRLFKPIDETRLLDTLLEQIDPTT